MTALRTLDQLPLTPGTRVLVRAGLNVPVREGSVTNEFRLRALLPTLTHLRARGAVVLLIGHIGRDPRATLAPVFRILARHVPLSFAGDILSARAAARISAAPAGAVLLFENIRKFAEEKRNDETFARALAARASYFVNDAFSASHRAHASIVGVPRFLPSAVGVQFAKEVAHLSRARTPESPALFILGGAKFATKVPLLREMLSVYDRIFIGGALANDFFRAKGWEVGRSLVSEETEGVASLLAHEKILLPEDVVVVNPEGVRALRLAHAVLPEERIVDIGPRSVRALARAVRASAFVLWNGPLGWFEGGFGGSTEAVAEEVAAHRAVSIVGGGDTIAAIARKGIEDCFTFLSTGGGAMLDYLAEGTLPGIQALEQSPAPSPDGCAA